MWQVMRFRYFFLGLSLLVILPGVWSLWQHGLQLSIDFTGGSLVEVRTKTEEVMTLEQVEVIVGDAAGIKSVQTAGPQQYILRSDTLSAEQQQAVLGALQQRYGELELLRLETVGPVLGQELVSKTLTAILLVSIFITLYVWKQFHEVRFGISAIFAMFHDTLVLLGVFSLLGWKLGVEVDVLFVTALLTTLSFSVHDTIVVYDRIREKQKQFKRAPFEQVVNAAVLETFGRSLNNSLTIIVMLLTLVLLGGGTIKWFAVALLVGSVTGTYSSTFTAAPLLLVWQDVFEWWQRRRRPR